jgi:hypothetical protein
MCHLEHGVSFTLASAQWTLFWLLGVSFPSSEQAQGAKRSSEWCQCVPVAGVTGLVLPLPARGCCRPPKQTKPGQLSPLWVMPRPLVKATLLLLEAGFP